MVHRILSLLICFLLLFSLTACIPEGEEMPGEPVPSASAATEPPVAPWPTPSPEAEEAPPETGPGDLSEQTPQPEPVPSPSAASEPPAGKVPERTEDSTFGIYFLDVGQGDAAVVLCDGEAMLIDGGGSPESDRIYSFLQKHRIQHLEYIIATHADADHVGGLAGALNYASVTTAFCTVTENDTQAFRNFTKYLSRRGCSITIPSPGETFELGCARVTIVYPKQGQTNSDNTSIALRVEYGDTAFFFTGDCESPDEEVILSSGYPLRSDVLKVSHHGSHYGTGNRLLRAVQPEYAVISVGGDNTYGHPSEEVLQRLDQQGVILFRTDIQGTVHCTSDGTSVAFDVEKNRDFDTYLAAGGYANYLAEQAAREKARESVAPTPEPRPSAEETEDEPAANYVANLNTKKFHEPSCASVRSMKESNKWYFTGSRQELIDDGFSPCKRCKP